MLSKPKYLLILIILFSIKTIGLCQFDINCHVPNKFDNAPLEEALNKWEGWCRVKFKYKYDVIGSIKIDGDEQLIPINKALNKALENTDLAWKERENNVIEILPRSEAIEFIKISNTFDGTSLEKVISIWGFNYGLEIDYNSADISGIKIYGSIENEPLDIAFEKVLSNTPINFTIEGDKKISLFVPEGKKLNEYASGEISYGITINGILKDEDTGESLPFANIIVAGTTHGTTTNLDGLFTLQDIPSDTSIIELSYIGYITKEVRLLPSMDLSNLEIYLNSGGTLIEEITVTAQKKDQILKQSGISKIAMTPEIASILPSTGEKDIFRSLQLLPGISGSNESSAGLYVRGGTPDQNLMILDGFTVYHVDHLYGFFSAFNSNAIKDIQLYKGGFEPKFGGRLSSVVDITAKDGNSQQFNAGFNLSFLSVNGFVESPFADGKGSFIITGRRSYQSFLYNKLFDSFTGSTEDANEPASGGFGGFGGFGQTQVQPTSYFYDLNAKVTYRPSIKDKITFSLYNGEDDLDNSRIIDNSSFGGGRFAELFGGGSNSDFTFANNNTDVSNWGNVGASFKWSRKWSDRFYTNAVASYSNYFSVRDQLNENTVTRADSTTINTSGSFEENDLKDLSFKLDSEFEISQNNKLEFGVQVIRNDIKYNYTQNDTISLIDRSNVATTSSLYIQDRITLMDRLILSGGIRLNNYSLTEKNYLEPRASFTYLIDEAFKLKGAYGQYNQFATRVIREDIQQGSRDFWILADDELIPTSKATHYILGASYDHKNYLFDVELFYKDYEGLSEYTTRFTSSGFGPDRSLDLNEQFFTGTGVAKGAEFLLQKKYGNFSGWLGYTWSKVEYDFPDFGENTFFANQDTRHEFKAVASYRLKQFDVSSTFIYATGRPYTAPIGYYEIPLLDDNIEPYFQVSEKNVLRYPSYHRLDISANYNFNINESKAKIGASIFNVYGRNNTWYKSYDVIEGQLLETDVSLLGFTPSLFFSWSLR